MISCTSAKKVNYNMLAHFRDHKVSCSRLRQGQIRKDFEADTRDELSVSGAHMSQSCCSTSLLLFVLVFASLSGHHHSLRREKRLTWKVGTQDLSERSKAGMGRSPQSKHLHRAHRGVPVLTSLPFDYQTHTSSPLLLFAFDCKCQKRPCLSHIHVSSSVHPGHLFCH